MVLLCWLLIRLLGCMPGQPDLHVLTGKAQGTTYTIKYLSENANVDQHAVDSIFRAIDQSMSLYDPGSLISIFNSKGVVRMDEHMKRVVSMAAEVNKHSGGRFDITTRPLSLLWGFGSSGDKRVPSSKQIRKTLGLVGADKIMIRNDSLIASGKGVQIDCNGIAQGYTVDVISEFLVQRGITDHLVELGGEVKGAGEFADGRSWQVGIESVSPVAGNWRPAKIVIALNNMAVTTSGDYNNYFTSKGKRYTHIIDPKTGRPVDNEVIAVTVIAGNAMAADAWDNGLYLMGVERALKMLALMPGIEAYFIYEDKNGNIRDTATKGFYGLVR